MHFLYSSIIQLFGFALHFLANFNAKAKKWIIGRKNWKEEILQKINNDENYIWIHCASAGEFEQAVPIITALKIKLPTFKIGVSFFSPSGFEMYKDSKLADVFFYFPLDTQKNANTLIDIIKPKLVIFIRNEIWLNTLTILHQKNIPTFLVNVNLKIKRNFFYQKYLNHAYSLFTKIFATNTYGHTKLERVIANRNTPYIDSIFNDFCKESVVIIVGSSWLTEEKYVLDFYSKYKIKYPELKIIIAPHEQLSISSLEVEKSSNKSCSFYSSYQKSDILILDKKGVLKYAYRYANIAIIGGGFEKSVHNVAEAAVYGIPTVFGSKYYNFEEIIELVNLKVAFPVINYNEFEEKLITLINETKMRNNISIKLEDYFSSQEDVSNKISTEILTYLK